MIPVHLLLHVFVQSATSKASACRVKRVQCTGCGGEYIYQLRRKATGSSQSVMFMRRGNAKMAAEAEAKQKLQKLLEHGIDPVPCPRCGMLQDFMIPVVRGRRLRWIGAIFGVAGLAVVMLWICIGLGLGAGAEDFAWWATIVFAAGLAASLAWALVGDLNARAHRRTREVLGARCRAMAAEELDALIAEEASASD